MIPLVFALVDCNSFFCACERVFQPKLQTRPVIVLSSNDGCVVSRTPEAKALGIPMGVPFFKIKELVKQHHVAVFSSNFGLYGDMSSRVMQTLGDLAPTLEIYSIDEAFLDMTGEKDLWEKAVFVGKRVLQDTGIPVSIGLGPTKTLAKAANYVAKKIGGVGVFDLNSSQVRDKILPHIPCHDIWGVGRAFAKTLAAQGLFSAQDIAVADPKRLRRTMGMLGERLCFELQGTPCLSLETAPIPRKSIICSRSFAAPLRDKEAVRKSLHTHLARACEKLRRAQLTTRHMSVFIQSNPFVHTGAPHTHTAACPLSLPSHHTPDLAHHLDILFERIWKPQVSFVKSGLMLCDLQENKGMAAHLFDTRDLGAQGRTMDVMDTLTKRHGRGVISFASTLSSQNHASPSWEMRSQYRSPAYTKSWDALPLVR